MGIGFTGPLNDQIASLKNQLAQKDTRITELTKKVTNQTTEIASLKKDLSSATEKVKENEKGKAVAKLVSLLDLSNESKGKVVASLYALLDSPLNPELVKPEELNNIFWDAVGPVYKANNLQMHKIGGNDYGADIDPALLTKNYKMPAPIALAVLNVFCVKLAGSKTSIAITADKKSMRVEISANKISSGISEICEAATALGLTSGMKKNEITLEIPLN